MKTKEKKKAAPNNPTGYNAGAHRPVKNTKEFVENEVQLLLKWLEKPENIFVKGFAIERKYHSSMFNEWCERYPSFALLYAQAKEIQEQKLLLGGMTGKYKEQITKFVLVNHHDYAEKTKQDVHTTGQVQVNIVNYGAPK